MSEEDKTVWMKGGKPCAFTDLDKDVQEGFWAKGFGLAFKPEPKAKPTRKTKKEATAE